MGWDGAKVRQYVSGPESESISTQPTNQPSDDRPMWPWHHRTRGYRIFNRVLLIHSSKNRYLKYFYNFSGSHVRKIEPCSAAQLAADTLADWASMSACGWMMGSKVFSCGNPLQPSEDERDFGRMWKKKRNRCTCLFVSLIWAIEAVHCGSVSMVRKFRNYAVGLREGIRLISMQLLDDNVT